MTFTIKSTFDTDTDGWTMNGDVASFVWMSSGGNPGGFVQWVDAATGADSYYVAPSKFLGAQSAYYGGTLSYDIEDTGADYSGVGDIELTGDGLTLVYVAGQAGTTWTHFSATLTAASGWKVGAHDTSVAGDPAATEAQMQEVLANLTSVEIRAEYVDGPETGGLDNVTMTTSGASAWNLWTSTAKSVFVGSFSTFAAALAAAKAGDDIAFANGGTGGGNLGSVAVKVNNLTVEADASVTASFLLTFAARTFSLGGAANAYVFGTAGADVITGNSGANFIQGNGGADTIYGMGGNDKIAIKSTPILVDGGDGTDSLYIEGVGVALNDSNVANVELFYVGSGDSLDFSGGVVGRKIISQSTASSAATIVGSQGADVIVAGAGADSITGGAGGDVIYAGSGSDVFHYDVSGFGRDLIRNVNLSKDVFDVKALGSSLADLSFVSVAAGAETRITGKGDTNPGDGIFLFGVSAADAKANGHYTF